MAMLGEAAQQRVGRPLSEFEIAELYSCFPVAVRVQQRELGLPLDSTPTVTGGMAFAGGPFNNFTYQATCDVVARLRAGVAPQALVTTVCGLLTKPGLAAWSADPDGKPPLLRDLAPSRSKRRTRPVVADHQGPATVATYTVTYEDGEPATTKIIGDLRGSRGPARCVAVCEDAQLARRAVAEELIGTTVEVDGGSFRA
jgi:acetyl-CoA C-acetyltransferase